MQKRGYESPIVERESASGTHFAPASFPAPPEVLDERPGPAVVSHERPGPAVISDERPGPPMISD